MRRHVPATRELGLPVVTRLDGLFLNRMNAIPGFKPGAAFFTSLRANLALPTNPHSAMSAHTSTPPPDASAHNLPPSPSHPSTPADAAPPLTTEILTSREDKTAALKLIADSIAQQRQIASKALILSPTFLFIWSIMIFILYKTTYHERMDIGVLLTTGGGGTMAMFLLCRIFSGNYLGEAENVTFGFLSDSDTGEEDVVLGTRFGNEVIGALVLRLAHPAANGKKGSKKGGKVHGGKALIRAWTVRLRFRHKGVGTGLLEEAVKVARENYGSDVQVGFATDHANSKMVLWEMFNERFRREQEMAVKLLEEVARGVDGEKGRKRR